MNEFLKKFRGDFFSIVAPGVYILIIIYIIFLSTFNNDATQWNRFITTIEGDVLR
jgi:hypothetical protein